MTDRELDATDHANAKMLLLYKSHLEAKQVTPPPKPADDDVWDDDERYAKDYCESINRDDIDPALILHAAPDAPSDASVEPEAAAR